MRTRLEIYTKPHADIYVIVKYTTVGCSNDILNYFLLYKSQ